MPDSQDRVVGERYRALRSHSRVGSGILPRFLESAPHLLSLRSDNELMLRIQAGDLEAFAQLVERYQAMVHGLAVSILRRTEDAEEAAQDTFLKVFRARSQFDGLRKVEPWLLRIAGNACRDRLRRRRTGELPVAQLEGPNADRDPMLDLPD